MFGTRINLFKFRGFPVRIDLSWFLILLLVTWSLAVGLFPMIYPSLGAGAYWLMGLIGALGLFASIVIHELSHATVARHYGLPMRGITLFIFGGVAEMQDEPPNPRVEFLVAIAGPLASIAIAIIVGIINALITGAVGRTPVWAVLRYLVWINLLLVAFNLIPAFPLDGGRVLRSALWYWKKNLRWATRVGTSIGVGFAYALIILGVITFITGNPIQGMWWFLIGLFLRTAARSSYQQMLMREVLKGEPVSRFMQPEPRTVPPTTTIREFVEEYVYRWHFKLFPISTDGRLVGCISTKRIAQVPREQWEQTTVSQVAERCSADNTIAASADAVQALAKMSRTGRSRLMVVDGDRLVGIVALKDLLRFVGLKLELEDTVEEAAPDTGEHREGLFSRRRHAA